ncbi:uncharacterized protein [Clytia hemisphaerica]|uniref:uncharacterized protein n=1 Tax=Clytia hemisphaerica TaxID=252671 RepID=UPI0034D4EF5D
MPTVMSFVKITHKSLWLQQGVANLDQEGKDEMLKLRPTLVKIFGDGMSDVIMKSLKETKLNRGKPKKKMTSLLGDRSFEMKFVSNSNDDFKPVPQHMSYHQGELFIDGNHISNAEVYQNKKIVWSKRDDGGRWYHGVFTIRNKGVTGKCILIKSKDFNCKQIISSTELEVKMVRNDYVMKKSVEEIPKDEDEDKDGRKKMKKSTKNEEFIDFGTMCIAIHKDEVSNDDIVEAGIQYPGMNNEEFFGSPVGYDTDTLKFHVEITIDKDMFSDPDGFDRDYDRYISFEGYVDMMSQKVDGVCYVYDPACPDNEGAKYKWDGELTHSDMFSRNADKAKKMACLRYIHTDPDEDFHHMQLNKKDDVNSPSKKYVSHGALQYTEAYYDGELSTQNLEYANFPDSDAANSILMDLVSMCVTHDIDGDLRTNILGTADPDFIGFSEVKKIAEDEKFKDTFGQKFGIAYLLQGLLQSDESKKFFTEDDKQRLVSYWKGTTKNCLSQDKDYAEAQRLLNRLVHIENTTIDDNQSLQDYLDDGGEKWAKNLYEAISTYDSITSMAMADSITKGNGPYHKYVMLLFCLAPDKEYCDLLHSDILTYRLQELHEYFEGTEEEIVDEQIKDVVKEFLSKLQTGELEDFNNVKAELLELKNEMQIDSMGEFSDTFANMCAGAMNYAFFQTQEGSFKGRLCKGIKKMCDDYNIISKITLVGKLVMGLGYAVGFYNCVKCLMKWDTLSDDQRATLVVDCMRYGTDIMKALFDIAADIDASLISGNWSWKLNKIFRSACAKLGIKEGKFAKMIYHNMGWQNSVFEVDMAESLADIEEAGKLEGRFGKFFKVSSKFLKGMTMVLSVANTALMGYKLFKDFRDDAPMYQIVLDGLQLMVGIGEIVFLVLEITTDLAFVPIVGQVLAVVGVILDIILLILAASMEQKTPAQIFIEGEGRDFLQTVEIDEEVLDDDDDDDDDGDSDNGSVRSRIRRIKRRIARRKRELADKKKRLENDQ